MARRFFFYDIFNVLFVIKLSSKVFAYKFSYWYYNYYSDNARDTLPFAEVYLFNDATYFGFKFDSEVT